MIEYQVTADSKTVDEALSLFKFLGGNTDQAVNAAINKAGPKIRTLSSKKIRDQVRLKASFLNEKKGSLKRLDFVRSTRRRLTGRITAQSRGLLLSHYDWKPKVSLIGKILTPESPIRVKVKKTGGVKEVRSSSQTGTTGSPFYIRLKGSNAVGIGLWRTTPGPKGGRVKVLYSRSVSQVFSDVKDEVTPAAADEFEYQTLDAIRYLLQKKHPRE